MPTHGNHRLRRHRLDGRTYGYRYTRITPDVMRIQRTPAGDWSVLALAGASHGYAERFATFTPVATGLTYDQADGYVRGKG